MVGVRWLVSNQRCLITAPPDIWKINGILSRVKRLVGIVIDFIGFAKIKSTPRKPVPNHLEVL